MSLILLNQREGEEREIRKLQEEMRPFSNNTERPAVPFNQNKVAHVCQYLQWLEDFLFTVFQKEVCLLTFTIWFILHIYK